MTHSIDITNDYTARCVRAADNQGLLTLGGHLFPDTTPLGVMGKIEQTGGFCMVLVVDRPDGSVWVVAGESVDHYNLGHWPSKDSFDQGDDPLREVTDVDRFAVSRIVGLGDFPNAPTPVHNVTPANVTRLLAMFADADANGRMVRVAWDGGLKVAVGGDMWTLPLSVEA